MLGPTITLSPTIHTPEVSGCIQLEGCLVSHGSFACPGSRILNPGQNLWDSVQKENAECLVQNHDEFQDGDGRAHI